MILLDGSVTGILLKEKMRDLDGTVVVFPDK
jgi:hypothetical protein